MSEQHPSRWPYYSVNLALWPGEFCQIGDVVDDFQTAHRMAAAAVEVHDIWTESRDAEHFAEIYGESRTFDGFTDEAFDWYTEGQHEEPATRELLAYVASDGLHPRDSARATELHTAMQDAFNAEVPADRTADDDADRALAVEHGAAFKGSVVTFPSLDVAGMFGEAKAKRSMLKMFDDMRGYTEDEAERANALVGRWQDTSAVGHQKNAQALADYLIDVHVFGQNRPGHTAGASNSMSDATRKTVQNEVAEVIRRDRGQ